MSAATSAEQAASTAPDAAEQPAPVPGRTRTDGRPWASPLARALARERGLDIQDVVPGPDGTVRAAHVADVHRRAQGAGPSTRVTEAGSFHLLVADVDVTGLERALRSGSEDVTARVGVRPSVFAAVMQLAVESLRRCPGVHADDASHPVHLSVLTGGDETWREVPDAGSLSFTGLLRALGTKVPEPTSDHRLAVIDSASRGMTLELMSPPVGARGVLTVGEVRRTVAVVTTDAESIAVRSVVQLGLSLDTSCVGRSEAVAFLRDLRSRVAGATALELGLPTTGASSAARHHR